MTDYTYDLNPVQHIVADALGEPGKRVFFLQARSGSAVVNLLMEKEEVANLAISILQLLEDLEEKYPDLPPLRRVKRVLHADKPFDPTFRVGQLVVGYDDGSDAIWVVAKALVPREPGEEADTESENVPAVRLVATREQMYLMSEHALEVVSQGRPICPLCNRPIDREGHFCPRTDGEAMPIIF